MGRQGVALAQRDCEQAMPFLLTAYRCLAKHISIVASLGFCYERLGDPESALRFRKEYRDYGQDENGQPLDPDAIATADRAIARLEAKLAEKERQRLLALLPPKRPAWRLALGGSMLALGGVLVGFGIPAFALHNTCIVPPTQPGEACSMKYNSQTLGIGLVAAGGAMALGGILTLAWPPKRKTATK